MRRSLSLMVVCVVMVGGLVLGGCRAAERDRGVAWSSSRPVERAVPAALGGHPLAMLPENIKLCRALGLDPMVIARLERMQLYAMSPVEVHQYLKYLHAREPDLRTRLGILARKNKGQAYEIFLLGESPFELYDAQPLYSLRKSDCVVYAEHTLAMGLGWDWESFFGFLQRIRYKDGQIGVATRNHFTESDWAPNNSWLYTEVTRELGGDRVVEFSQRVNRSASLRRTFGVETEIPIESRVDAYLPYEEAGVALEGLRTGDLALIVRGKGVENLWVGHVTMVIRNEDGTIHLIHSAQPVVREESIQQLIRNEVGRIPTKQAEGKGWFHGFKFLRLNDEPLQRLAEVDGVGAPVIKVPVGALITSEPVRPVIEVE
ncbi:MAG: DUF1460 domain-containing protein [Phycisphaeraceae bacterium]